MRFGKLKELVRNYYNKNNFTCDVCGREVFGGERVCAQCKKTLPLNNGAICPKCGRKVLEAGVCLECKARPPKCDKARSVCVYEGEAARLVLSFKNGAKYFYRTMAELMLPVFNREFADADFITFVPMTKKAEKRRGFNQSFLVAEELAKRTGKELFRTITKVRDTSPQKTLTAAERETNLQGCFRLTNKSAVKGKRILIIDDTYTTGATTSTIAALFKRAHALEVNALTFASVQYKNPFGTLKPKEKEKIKF